MNKNNFCENEFCVSNLNGWCQFSQFEKADDCNARERYKAAQWVDAKSEDPPDENQWNSCWWLIKREGKIPERALFVGKKWVQENGDKIYDVSYWRPLPGESRMSKKEIIESRQAVADVLVRNDKRYEEWVLDVSFSTPCFCPFDRETGEIVVGLNVITDKCPGELVGVVHRGGDEMAEKWCDENPGWHKRFSGKQSKLGKGHKGSKVMAIGRTPANDWRTK